MTFIRNIMLITGPSLLVTFILLELIFTFIIPASQFPYYYYDPNDHILKFSTTDQREGLYTIGSMAQQRARWRINDAGWNSAIEFIKTKHKPRIAIIGDSYVEALQVNVDESIAPRLSRLLSHGRQMDVDVYAFGISGAPLSQYLQMARYAHMHFNPDILVINVVHNDFDESLCSIKQQVGMLCLQDDGDSVQEASIIPYQPDPVLRMVRRSALVRYVMMNLQLPKQFQRPFLSKRARRDYNANIDVREVQFSESRIRKATDYVLKALMREYGSTPIVLLIDAPRKDIYADTVNTSDVRWLNDLIKEKSLQYGLHCLDLTDEFTKVFKSERVHLESRYDWHWNERGHEAAASALYSKLQSLSLFENWQARHRSVAKFPPLKDSLHNSEDL